MSTYNWKGGAGNWTTSTNWTPTGAPGDGDFGDDVVFTDTTPGIVNAVSLGGATIVISQMALNGPDNGGGYSFSDGALDFVNGQISASTDANFPDFEGQQITIGVTGELQLDTANSASTLDFGGGATISGSGYLQIMGLGTTTLGDADSYAGGTQILGGTLAIGNMSALSTGAVSFVAGGASPVLQSVSGPLSNAIDIEAGAGATIGAEKGDTLSLNGPFTDNGGAGTTLHFGSTGDTGEVLFDPSSDGGVAADSALSVDGGTLIIGDFAASQVVGAMAGGVAVGPGTTTATLDIHGNATTLPNLTGSSGVITNNGATSATLTVDDPADTVFYGRIEDGTSALSLVVASGALTLGGNNSFSGGVTLDVDSILRLNTNSAAGTGIITLKGGNTLFLASGVTSVNALAGLGGGSVIGLDGFDSSSVVSVTPGTIGEALTVTDGAKVKTIGLLSAFTQAQLGVLDVTNPYEAFLSPDINYSSGSNALVLAGGSATTVNLSNTANYWDAVSGPSGVINMDAAQTTATGGVYTANFTGGSGNAVSFINSSGWNWVYGSNGAVYLNSAQASVQGGGDMISFVSGADQASLYNTGSWDQVFATSGTVNLNSALTTIQGGAESVYFTSGSGNAASFIDSSGWDWVYGSKGTIYLNSAQTSIQGGANNVYFSSGSDSVSLYKSNGVWGWVYGSNGEINLSDNAQTSIQGGGDKITLDGNSADAVSLYSSGGNWDLVAATNGTIDMIGAQASVTGNSNTFNMAGANTVSAFGASDAFIFAPAIGVDTINDFASTDTLQFSKTDFASFTALQNSGDMTQNGANTLISLAGSGTVILTGVTMTNLGPSEFKFV